MEVKLIIQIFIITIVVTRIVIKVINIVSVYVDNNKDYEKEGVNYSRISLDNRTHIFIECIEGWMPNKYAYIKKHYYQGVDIEVEDQHYTITEIVSENYALDPQVTTSSKGFLFKVVTPFELNSGQSVNFNGDINAPTQISGHNSIQEQNISDSSFKNELNKYCLKMIEHGIPENDIKNVIKYEDDPTVRKSFLEKYAIDLLNIAVNIAGVTTNLYDILSKFK